MKKYVLIITVVVALVIPVSINAQVFNAGNSTLPQAQQEAAKKEEEQKQQKQAQVVNTQPKSTGVTIKQYVPLVADFQQVLPSGGKEGDFAGFFNYLLKTVIGLAGILAVLMIVIGGIQYVSTDSWSGKDSGKKRIQAALGGLLLALSSYLILNTIDPSLTYLNFASNLKVGQDNAENNGTATGGGNWETGGSNTNGAPVGNVDNLGGVVDPNFLNNFESPVSMLVRTTHYHQTEPDATNDEDTKNFRSSTGVTLRDGGASQVGVVAVAAKGIDAGKIPYGSIVVIDGNYYIAADTGGAVNNRTASNGEFPIVDVFASTWNDRNMTITVYPYKGNFLGLSITEKEKFFVRANFK